MENETHHQERTSFKRIQTLQVGMLSLTALVLTVIWLVLLVYGMVRIGPAVTLAEAMAVANKLDSLFYVTYINAALITIAVTALFAGLYVCYRQIAPLWSAVALIFVPPYTLLNLFVYLSQVTIIPRLLSINHAAPNQGGISPS